MANFWMATLSMGMFGKGVQSALRARDWLGSLTAWHTWHDPQTALSVLQSLGEYLSACSYPSTSLAVPGVGVFLSLVVPLPDHLVHACPGDQHLVKYEELPVFDTDSSQPRQLRLPFGAGLPMGSSILRLAVVLFPVVHKKRCKGGCLGVERQRLAGNLPLPRH